MISMKKYLALLLFFTAFLFQSCLKDKILYTYTMAIPVYQSKAAVYTNIRSNDPQQVESPGKLFITGNYIFLNEVDKGVHVIDNSNPANPVLKAFINIPGNLDIAVKGHTLYADLYTDLVVVDITNPLAARFEKYIPMVFPARNYGGSFVADSSRVIVDWVRKDTTVDYSAYLSWQRKDVMLYATAGAGGMQNNANGGNQAGIAGSMARFSVVDNYMYCLNSRQLRTYSLGNPLDPQQASVVNMPWNIETLYPFRNKLFIGSSTGMFIYDISNPAVPVQEGQFQHARSCDPVIADGNYAYVTLRDGSACFGTSNQLDVLDITSMSSPFLLHSYTMTNPHGLSKSGDLLFICDGRDGLKMYDAANPNNLQLKKHITGLETYDAIAWNNNLIVVAKDGLYQYDYSDPASLSLRSKISVNRNK